LDISKWTNVKILPQRSLTHYPHYEPIVIGTLHTILRRASNPSNKYAHEYERLARLMIDHYHDTKTSSYYLNSSMRQWTMDITEYTPLQIVALNGHKQLFEQLVSAAMPPPSSSSPSSMVHINELKLRQLLRRIPLSSASTESKGLSASSAPFHHLPFEGIDDFEIDMKSADIIPQGQHSKVYKAIRKNHINPWNQDIIYAVKIILLSERVTLDHIANELLVIDRRRTDSVNRLVGLSANENEVTIITEYANGGTLESYLPELLNKKQSLLNDAGYSHLTIAQRQWIYLRHIGRMITSGFHQLIAHHKNQILHRDIRLSNIVLHHTLHDLRNFEVEFIDWGFATRSGLLTSSLDESKERKEDPYFYAVNAPEVLDGKEYTRESEMWSFGMVLLSFWTCEKPINSALLDDRVRY
jgi:tRNA A-37 threonylcarbamoyl transferase component Bud32